TLVIQSCGARGRTGWLAACMDSVRHWAAARGYGYEFVGDEIFGKVPPWYLEKVADRRPVATDYARLALLHEALHEGRADRVIWLDADVLVFDPTLELDCRATCAFGQELWVQED